jgi:hypothetical protein
MGRGAGNSGSSGGRGGAEPAGPPVGGRGRGRPQQAAQPSSVEEMEQGLKRLLNIAHSPGGRNPLMDALEETPGDDKKNIPNQWYRQQKLQFLVPADLCTMYDASVVH